MSDVSFSDHESGEGGRGGNNGFSYNQITLELWRRCLALGCVEFRGGYTNKIINGNVVIEQYIPSSSETWINAVWSFYDACLPKFDKLMKEASKTHMGKLNQLNKEDIEGKRLTVKAIFQELTKLLGRLRFFEGGKMDT